MRKSALLVTSIVVVAATLSLVRPSRSAVGSDPKQQKCSLNDGDHVRIYLNRTTSSSPDSVEGIYRFVASPDYCVEGEVSNTLLKDKKLFEDVQHVVRMIPPSSVLYVEKILDERLEPTKVP